MASQDEATILNMAQEFEIQNPKVGEALKLFGLSMSKYHGALNAMQRPTSFIANHTTQDTSGFNEKELDAEPVSDSRRNQQD